MPVATLPAPTPCMPAACVSLPVLTGPFFCLTPAPGLLPGRCVIHVIIVRVYWYWPILPLLLHAAALAFTAFYCSPALAAAFRGAADRLPPATFLPSRYSAVMVLVLACSPVPLAACAMVCSLLVLPSRSRSDYPRYAAIRRHWRRRGWMDYISSSCAFCLRCALRKERRRGARGSRRAPFAVCKGAGSVAFVRLRARRRRRLRAPRAAPPARARCFSAPAAHARARALRYRAPRAHAAAAAAPRRALPPRRACVGVGSCYLPACLCLSPPLPPASRFCRMVWWFVPLFLITVGRWIFTVVNHLPWVLNDYDYRSVMVNYRYRPLPRYIRF